MFNALPNKNFLFKACAAGLLFLIIGFGIGYQIGRTKGQNAGYQKAIVDTKATQEALAKKATDEAAKAANPFQAKNPLEGVTANPFEEVVKKLNPFAQ